MSEPHAFAIPAFVARIGRRLPQLPPTLVLVGVV